MVSCAARWPSTASKTVFHLGAQTLVGVAKVDPTSTLDANIRGTWMVLEAARQANVKQVLVASSDKAYGDSDPAALSRGPSAAGSLSVRGFKELRGLITTMYARTYGMQAAVVRCGNLFGGGDLNFSRLIPGAIVATLKGENFLIRSDGKYVRDFLYVEDAAEAYIVLAERLRRNPRWPARLSFRARAPPHHARSRRENPGDDGALRPASGSAEHCLG